jgi:RimJ/RimL family protein N-acetyltransferase
MVGNGDKVEHLLIAETPRLWLRAWREEDLDALQAYFGDPEVMRYITGEPMDRERCREFLGRRLAMQQEWQVQFWALCKKRPDGVRREDDEVIGHCGLAPSDIVREDGRPFPPSGMPGAGERIQVELGYALRRSEWRKGYTTEASRAALKHGFERLSLERIVALADPRTEASLAVMRTLGMRDAGVAVYRGKDRVVIYEVGRR